MNIVISEGSLFSNSPERSMFSSHHAGNNTSISKISGVKGVEDHRSDIIREAEQSYVAENTPAVNISISSMGKAAIMSLNSMNTGLKKFEETADIYDKSQVYSANDDKTSPYTLDLETEETTENDDKGAFEVRGADKNTEVHSSKNTANLAMYTDQQLRNMVNDGDITRGEMQDELDKRVKPEETQKVDVNPVMKQAIAAYNYQMAYQINAQMFN